MFCQRALLTKNIAAGIKMLHSNRYGDQYVRINVIIPVYVLCSFSLTFFVNFFLAICFLLLLILCTGVSHLSIMCFCLMNMKLCFSFVASVNPLSEIPYCPKL